MISREERNKFLAGCVGGCYHEFEEVYPAVEYNCSARKRCKNCGGEIGGEEEDTLTYDECFNPDYHTAEGRQRLLEWAVEQKWFDDFTSYARPMGALSSWSSDKQLMMNLLIPESALAEAVYEYLKGREG